MKLIKKLIILFNVIKIKTEYIKYKSNKSKYKWKMKGNITLFVQRLEIIAGQLQIL